MNTYPKVITADKYPAEFSPSVRGNWPASMWVPRIAGLLVMLIGTVVLIGWASDSESLKRIFSQTAAMNPMTALCFALMGAALMARRDVASYGSSANAVGPMRILGVVVAGVGLAKFAELLFSLNVGFDKLLFAEKLVGPAAVASNLMAPNTALCLTFLGASLFCLSGRAPRLIAAGQIFAACAAVITVVAAGRYFPAGLNNTLATVVLAAGLLWSYPHHGVMALLNRHGLSAKSELPFSFTMLAGAFITLVTIICASFWGEEQTRASVDAIARTREIQLHIERTLTSLQTARTEQRSFLLTGEEKYLASLDQAEAAARDSFRSLAAVSRKTAADQSSISDIALYIDVNLMGLRADIAVLRAAGPQAAISAIKSGDGDASMQKLRAVIATMNAAEEAVLGQQADRQEKILLFVRIAEVFGIAILIVVGLTLTAQAKQALNAQKSARDREAAATAAAKAANRSKSEFLASMSHEIRTPLNGVIGNLELLAQSELAAEQEELLFDADKAAKSLLALIGNVLDFSKIEAGKLAVENVDIKPDAVIQEAVDIVQSRARQKGIQVTASIGPGVPETIKGDPTRIRQILLNLLGNAVKFTAAGGVHVRLTVKAWEGNICHLLFAVHDSGRGFEPSIAGELFEAFTQDNKNLIDTTEGTGLGLSICRSLVETFGGEIGSEAVPGGGATFWFTLPVHVVVPEQIAPRHDLSGRTTLIVSPMPGPSLDGLLGYFQSRGACVLVAESAEAALVTGRKTLLKGAHIDLAIYFQQGSIWPDPNVAATLREQGAVPIIFGTPGAATDWRAALQSGASYLLAGFSDESTIDRNIRRILGGTTRVGVIGNRSAKIIHSDKAALTGKHLLVLEDRLVNQTIIQRQLKTLGITCTIAANGVEGLARVDSVEHYDAILCDCSMPKMNGYEFTRALRKLEQDRADGSHLPIIAMTANAFREDMETCFNAGMDDFVSKPVTLARLVAVLMQWLTNDLVPAGDPAVHEPDSTKPIAEDAIDVTALRELLGTDDRDVVLQILEEFKDAAWNSWREVEGKAADNDTPGLCRAAHGAKGEAKSAGAATLGELYETLEISAKTGHTGNIRPVMRRIPAELSRITDYINSYHANGLT